MISTPSAAADASRAPDTESATRPVRCSGEVGTFRYRPGLRSPPGTRCRPDHHGRPQSPGHLERTPGGPPGRIRPGRPDECISVQLSQDAYDRIARPLHWKRSPPSTREEPPFGTW